MKKQMYLFLILLVRIDFLFGQSVQPGIICGQDLFSQLVRERYPELHQAFETTFEQARQAKPAQDRSPLNINVVVHVVWNNPAENLHDSIVLNQIKVLNEDFNRLNADTANLRTLFQPVAGAADIHFNLAAIVRVQTTTLFELDLLSGTFFTELKKNATGGSDAWNPDKFLNIWVCKIQPTTFLGIPVGQVLGLAFPPNGLDNWPDQSGAPTPGEDGVVIDFRAFGRNNPNPLEDLSGSGGNMVIRGRTPVHEVAHYLGLRHIWGDGGLLGPNDCNQSDGIDDTPYASAQSDFDCDKTKNTCQKIEPFYQIDAPDLVENYMDYSSETCMNMFTKGQVQLMRNVLAGPRSSLIESTATHSPTAALEAQLMPNPAGDQTTLSFYLDRSRPVAIRLFGLDGRLLTDMPAQEYGAGNHQVLLETGRLESGLYLLELRAGDDRLVRKLCRQ